MGDICYLVAVTAEYGYICLFYSGCCQFIKLLLNLKEYFVGRICLFLLILIVFFVFLALGHDIYVALAVSFGTDLLNLLVGVFNGGVTVTGLADVVHLRHLNSLWKQGVVEIDHVLMTAVIALHRYRLWVVNGKLFLHPGVENVPVTVAPAVDGLFDISYHKAVLAYGQALPEQQAQVAPLQA